MLTSDTNWFSFSPCKASKHGSAVLYRRQRRRKSITYCSQATILISIEHKRSKNHVTVHLLIAGEAQLICLKQDHASYSDPLNSLAEAYMCSRFTSQGTSRTMPPIPVDQNKAMQQVHNCNTAIGDGQAGNSAEPVMQLHLILSLLN